MSSHHLWTIQCQETNDCSGDLIINLPSELLNQMALAIGDDLAVDVVGRSIILRPISDLATRQARIGVAARQDFSRTYRHRLRYLLNISTSQHLNISTSQHLNISTDATDGQLHELVETGLTGSSLQGLRAIGIVNIDVQPLQSSDARLSNSESDYLYRIAHILALAESFCGDVEKAKCWLSKPKSQFSGRMPIEMLSTTPGTNRVEELLTQAKEGMLLLGVTTCNRNGTDLQSSRFSTGIDCVYPALRTSIDCKRTCIQPLRPAIRPAIERNRPGLNATEKPMI